MRNSTLKKYFPLIMAALFLQAVPKLTLSSSIMIGIAKSQRTKKYMATKIRI